MRTFLERSFVVVLALLAGACAKTQGSAAPPPKADMAAIQAAADSFNTAFVAAVAARDTDAVTAAYAEDAHILPAGMPRADGRDAIRKMWAEYLRMPGLVFEPKSNTLVASDAGDLVVDLGTYELKWQDAKGHEMHEVGKYATTMKKTDGSWKIVVDTWNSDGPNTPQ
jgi:ketosteroid isomerase-like protein